MPESPEQYQPTKEEIKKAEDMMTDKEKQISEQIFDQKEKEIAEKIKSGQIKTWDKEVKDFEKEKEEKMKKHAPLFFVYRNNALFEKQFPIVKKYLVEMNRQVDAKIFPQGTPETEIEEWYEENKTILSKKAIISDRTAQIPYKMEKEVKYDLGARKVEDLDRLIYKVMNRILFDKSEINYGGKRETTKEFMVTIIKNILMDKDKHPQKILIFPSRMADHLESTDEEQGEKVYKKEISVEEGIKYVVEKIKEWFVEGGVDYQKIEEREEEICSKPNAYGISYVLSDILEKFDKPNHWIIVDRHTGVKPGSTNSAIVLGMPQGNFFEDAKENGLINYSEEKMENEWKNILKETFES